MFVSVIWAVFVPFSCPCEALFAHSANKEKEEQVDHPGHDLVLLALPLMLTGHTWLSLCLDLAKIAFDWTGRPFGWVSVSAYESSEKRMVTRNALSLREYPVGIERQGEAALTILMAS